MGRSLPCSTCRHKVKVTEGPAVPLMVELWTVTKRWDGAWPVVDFKHKALPSQRKVRQDLLISQIVGYMQWHGQDWSSVVNTWNKPLWCCSTIQGGLDWSGILKFSANIRSHSDAQGATPLKVTILPCPLGMCDQNIKPSRLRSQFPRSRTRLLSDTMDDWVAGSCDSCRPFWLSFRIPSCCTFYGRTHPKWSQRSLDHLQKYGKPFEIRNFEAVEETKGGSTMRLRRERGKSDWGTEHVPVASAWIPPFAKAWMGKEIQHSVVNTLCRLT